MRPYEVMIILDAGLEESSIQAVINRSTEILDANGGNVARVDKWGRRRLAYEINKKVEGFYVLVEMSAGNEGVEALDTYLRLADDVVRHKIVRVPEHALGRPRPTITEEPVTAGPGRGRDRDED